MMRVIFSLLLLSVIFASGCTNFKVNHIYQPVDYYENGKLPIATQQDLISSAADKAFSQIRFTKLAGKSGYIEVTGVYDDELLTNYMAAKCEERMAFAGAAILPQKLKIFDVTQTNDNIDLKNSNYYNTSANVPFFHNKMLDKNRHRGIYTPLFNYYIEPVDADYKFQVIVESAGVNIRNAFSHEAGWEEKKVTYSGEVNITVAAVPLKPGVYGDVQKGKAEGERVVMHYRRCIIPVFGWLVNAFNYTDNDAPYIPTVKGVLDSK